MTRLRYRLTIWCALMRWHPRMTWRTVAMIQVSSRRRFWWWLILITPHPLRAWRQSARWANGEFGNRRVD